MGNLVILDLTGNLYRSGSTTVCLCDTVKGFFFYVDNPRLMMGLHPFKLPKLIVSEK